jgi:hypothetical protein
MALTKAEKQKRETHRALGRYVETFSHLIFQMRWLTAAKIAQPGADLRVGDLALGHGGAQHIADAFFGICRHVGNLDDAERNIANQLQTEVSEKVTERNKILHGDWWTTSGSGSLEDPHAAQLVRFYPQARDGEFERVEHYTPKQLDAISDRIFALRVLLSDFGRCALGLPMLKSDLFVAPPGEYRVRDILKAENLPKNGKGGTVARTGPRADEVAEGPVYT